MGRKNARMYRLKSIGRTNLENTMYIYFLSALYMYV